MIQVTCTACKTALEVDDAFAGGVCRCSHCGAIQTVPTPGDARGARPKARTLFRKQGQAVVGSGLDELAQVVASSGLATSRQSTPRLPSASADAGDTHSPHPPARRRSALPWVIVGVGGIALLVTVLWLARPAGVDRPGTAPADAGTVAAAGPSFAGIDLSRHRAVVFLIDRGTSSAPVLSPLKVMTLRGASSLGLERQFAIVFWSAGEGLVSYPTSGLAYSVDESISAARRTLEDVVPFGQTDALAPLETALSNPVDAVVVVTAKGFDLDDAWADRALQIRSASRSPTTTVHTLSIGSAAESVGLRRLADRTGGRYLELSPTAVRELGSE